MLQNLSSESHIGFYHANLTQETKLCTYQSASSSIKCLVATMAFGIVSCEYIIIHEIFISWHICQGYGYPRCWWSVSQLYQVLSFAKINRSSVKLYCLVVWSCRHSYKTNQYVHKFTIPSNLSEKGSFGKCRWRVEWRIRIVLRCLLCLTCWLDNQQWRNSKEGCSKGHQTPARI